MPRNILVVGIKERCLNFVVEGKLSVVALKETIRVQEGVPTDSYFLVQNGSPVDDSCELEDAEDYSTTVVRAYPTLKGGKGGFGSLIRAMGMQINKSTNKNACRDLSGRRVRDVKAEKEIAEWIKKEPERQKQKRDEKRKRREKRMEEPKHYFSDPKYMQQMQSTSEEIQDALKQGMEAATSSKAGKRKNPEIEPDGSSKKAKLWLGIEGLSSGSDEDSEDATSERSPTSPAGQDIEDEHQEKGDGVTSVGGGGVTSGDDVVTSSDGAVTSDGGITAGDAKSTTGIGLAGESTKTVTVCAESTAVTVVKENYTTTHSGVQEGNATSIACSSSREGHGSSSASKDAVPEAVCLDNYSTVEELEAVGAERLKAALQTMGLKCGGTVKERAHRLFSTKGKGLDQLDRALFAKPTRQQK